MKKMVLIAAIVGMFTLMLGAGSAHAQRTAAYFEKGGSAVEVWCDPALTAKKSQWTLFRDATGVLAKNGWKRVSSKGNKKTVATISADMEIEYAASENGVFLIQAETLTQSLEIILFIKGKPITLFMPFDPESANPQDLVDLINAAAK